MAWSPECPRPSIVMTSLPATSAIGTEHERTASRFTITVQAPHKPSPQPNLVPVITRSLRNTQSSMRSSSASTLASLPLRVNDNVRSIKTSESDSELLNPFTSVAPCARLDKRAEASDHGVHDLHTA